MRILTQTNDGFIVAQKDLELRGPGDLMGTRQSGEMMADFLLDGDVKLLDEAAKCMKRLRETQIGGGASTSGSGSTAQLSR